MLWKVQIARRRTKGRWVNINLVLNPLLLPTDAHNVKKRKLLKHSKLDKSAPTCFGLHRNHLQGAKKINLVLCKTMVLPN